MEEGWKKDGRRMGEGWKKDGRLIDILNSSSLSSR
jgi:hypothetical protein